MKREIMRNTLKNLKMLVPDFEQNEFHIEWMRFEEDSKSPEIV
jgi:hypothetical protein